MTEGVENANLLLSFYGDDFTGSTDVMESLVRAGVETVLFVDSPTPELLAKFPRARAVGIAGASRTMSPEQMEAELKPAFERLRELGAPVVHYKICSTFDSSPHLGNIGRAIDIGQRVIPGPTVPLIVGAPILGRYCAFGNLFARSGLDTVTDGHLATVGQLVWELASRQGPKQQGPLFVAGSSGVEYALTAHWHATGELAEITPPCPIRPVDRVAILSGSCSPVTERQIGWALEHGFAEISLETPSLVDPETARQAHFAAIDQATRLAQGV